MVAVTVYLILLLVSCSLAVFPKDFIWGSATAAYQVCLLFLCNFHFVNIVHRSKGLTTCLEEGVCYHTFFYFIYS